MSTTRGRIGAVEDVYASHYSAFCRMAMAVTGDPDSGRDAVQEGFAKGLARLESYRGDGPLPAWLWRIILRTALDSRQTRARDDLHPDDLLAEPGAWDPVLPHPERDPELTAAVSSLPPQQRLIVFLRYFADLSHADIAQIAGIEAGTVSATLTQAKSALARRLDVDRAPRVETEGTR